MLIVILITGYLILLIGNGHLSILEFFSDAFREFIIRHDGYVNATGDGSKVNPYYLSEK